METRSKRRAAAGAVPPDEEEHLQPQVEPEAEPPVEPQVEQQVEHQVEQEDQVEQEEQVDRPVSPNSTVLFVDGMPMQNWPMSPIEPPGSDAGQALHHSPVHPSDVTVALSEGSARPSLASTLSVHDSFEDNIESPVVPIVPVQLFPAIRALPMCIIM